MEPALFMTRSLHDERIAHILAAALQAVDPGRVVTAYLQAHPLPEGGYLFRKLDKKSP